MNNSIINKNMENREIAAAIALIESHIKLWTEPESAKRLALAESIYSEQIKVTDPGAILNGHEEVSGFIGDLLANNPGFEFRIAKPIETHHNMGILNWQFGPPSEPDKITGQDIFEIAEGRISSLLVFVNGATQATTN